MPTMLPTVRIGNREIGPGRPAYLVAEIGINHNGDPAIAGRLIDVAAEAGVDAVKFQKRTPRAILTAAGYDRPYESENAFAPTYGAHREKLELSGQAYRDLAAYARSRGLDFFASVWDVQSADFMESLGVPAFKIASADLTNLPLLDYVARKGRPMIVSTGMSTMAEVDEAVAAVRRSNVQLILMHCVSAYPCENRDVNLRTMAALAERFGTPVGYSGHDRGVAIPVAAVALGANVIEKHITLDRAMKGSDHAAALEPDGLKRVVRYIRNVEAAFGDGEKRIIPQELAIREKLAKSVATAAAIAADAVIRADMLTVKGPGTGLAPRHLTALVGRVAARSLEADTLVPADALSWPPASPRS